jgi:hypothetical protein
MRLAWVRHEISTASVLLLHHTKSVRFLLPRLQFLELLHQKWIYVAIKHKNDIMSQLQI